MLNQKGHSHFFLSRKHGKPGEGEMKMQKKYGEKDTVKESVWSESKLEKVPKEKKG